MGKARMKEKATRLEKTPFRISSYFDHQDIKETFLYVEDPEGIQKMGSKNEELIFDIFVENSQKGNNQNYIIDTRFLFQLFYRTSISQHDLGSILFSDSLKDYVGQKDKRPMSSMNAHYRLIIKTVDKGVECKNEISFEYLCSEYMLKSNREEMNN